MQQAQATSTNEIPRLIAELRDHIVRKTGKPIDPDVDFLTTQIEMLSMVRPMSGDWLEVGFTASELRIVRALASRPGMTFSRDAIANALYFDKREEAIPKIVDVHVRKIRVKLAKCGSARWVETVWGLGYRLVHRNAAEALAVLESGHKEQQYRKSKRVEWRPGILLGHKQAALADILFARLGFLVASGDLAKSCAMNPGSLTEQMKSITRTLTGTAYRVENKKGYGFRMVLNA